MNASEGVITIVFPNGTTVPSGAISGVTLNGTSASAAGEGDTVFVTTPVKIENGQAIQIVMALGSGLKNPVIAGPYSLSIKTSSETTFVNSDSYTISSPDQLSISRIMAKPDTVNQSDAFQFEFRTGSFGSLAAGIDSIYMIVEPNTYIPSNLLASNVSVSSGDFTDNATSVSVRNNVTADDDTVVIVTPITIGNSATASITFNNSAGYMNPSVARNYVLKMFTSKETETVTSNPFSISNTLTTVSKAIVTPGSNSTSVLTSYTIDFDLGRLGRLKPGESTITLTFASAYTLNSSASVYDNTQISVGGGAYVSVPTENITADNTAKTIVIVIPEDVITGNSDNISLIIDGNTTKPITNPSTSGSYVLGVKTSVESANINSSTYGIGDTSITINSVSVVPSTVNNAAQYTFNITTQTRMRSIPNDYVKIVFPTDTDLPETIAPNNVQISGQDAASVTVNKDNRSVIAVISQNIPASTFDVVIQAAANIRNPIVPSVTFYKVTMNTSQDINPVTSAAYTITSANTQVSSVSASANPAVITASDAAYTVNFTTSANGKIAGGRPAGSGTINILLTGTVIPTSIPSGTVSVNSMPSNTISVVTAGLGGEVSITMPSGLTIGDNSAVTVAFDCNAGLRNGETSGTYNVQVKTSSDAVFQTGTYILSEAQDLSVTSVTPNPATQNSNASYSVKFTTGSLGALNTADSDSIKIIFPFNTFLPTNISRNDITVNGTTLTVNPTVTGQALRMLVPADINALTAATVLINQSTGVLNPTQVQSYTLDITTTKEAGPFRSPGYNITQTSSTVSAATVNPAVPSTSSQSKYTITFDTGTNGRLLAGTSTITVTFYTSTTVSSTSADYDSTYIIANNLTTQIPTGNISVSGRAITITVPTGVIVGNNSNVSIILNRSGAIKPITNPSTSGSYTLTVRTSVETSNITSNSYTISDAAPVTNVTVNVDPAIVNATATDTINFTVQNTLSAGSGTVTITFPFNTFVPTSISTANVRVANAAANPANWTNASAVSTNPSSRTITVTVPNNISANDQVRVAFLSSAGIQNPSIDQSYTLNVRTSTQPLDAISASYVLQPTTTTIQNLQVDIVPLEVSVPGQYTFTFSTGSLGRLISGNSIIGIIFPYPYDIEFTLGTPQTSKVKVNNTNAAAVTLYDRVSTDADTLLITVPSSVTIGNNTNVTVFIDSTAGVLNASTQASLIYNVYTSVERTPSGTDFALPVQLSSFTTESVNGAVRLNWVTESELQNANWIIERKELSRDEYEQIQQGSISVYNTSENFREISRIDGQGSTSLTSYYTYLDSLVQVRRVYAYRIADVSYQGYVNYHSVVYQEVTGPQGFYLSQNFPNPFNPQTWIKFQLPVEAQVELKIYNVLGQVVKVLVDNDMKAGFHEVQWDGTNLNRQRVASGIYFYRLQVKSSNNGYHIYNQSMKMILMQ
jgi:hypothetical protein